MDTQKDFQTLQKAIHSIEHKADTSQLKESEIAKYQHFLDRLARKYQNDESLGTQRFMLYELQAMIWQARGDNEHAVSFLQEASSVKGPGESFISNAGRSWALQPETVTTPRSVIMHVDWSPAKLFWVSIFFMAIFVMLTQAKWGLLFTIVPYILFLALLVDSIATKTRNVVRSRRPT